MELPAGPAGNSGQPPIAPAIENRSFMLVEMAMSRGDALMRAERWEEALGAFLDAARLSGDDGLGHAAQADAFRSAGIAHMRLHAWDHAERYFETSYGFAETLADDGRMALARNAHAAAAFERGSWRSARTLYAEARRHAKSAGNARLLAQIDNNEGALLSAIGHPQKAETCFRRALDYFEQLDQHPCAASTLNNLGVALVAQKRWWDALAVYEKATRECQRTGDCVLTAKVMLNRADLAHDRGNEHQAELLATRALMFAERSGDLTVQSGAAKRLGSVARSVGRFGSAKAHLERAVAIAERGEAPLAAAEAWVEMGHLLSETEDSPEPARAAWQRARMLFHQLGNEVEVDHIDRVIRSVPSTPSGSQKRHRHDDDREFPRRAACNPEHFESPPMALRAAC